MRTNSWSTLQAILRRGLGRAKHAIASRVKGPQLEGEEEGQGGEEEQKEEEQQQATGFRRTIELSLSR